MLQKRIPLRWLAASPLLCAMMCALHHERGQSLPTNRLTLYEECVKMLLGERDKRRDIVLEEYPDLSNEVTVKLALFIVTGMLAL